MRQHLPWWAKIGTKILLSRLPIEYATVWKRLGLFLLGHMEEPAYAFGVFRKHFERSKQHIPDGFVGLELGPGDSLFSALSAAAFGASAFHLVDSGDFATTEVQRYRLMSTFLKDSGYATPTRTDWQSLGAVLQAHHATYGTAGLASLKQIPSQSVDFIFSHTVLQHIRRAEFAETLRELRRILRPGGVCSHVVDLKDMLGGQLNHLRFSERVWESPFMSRSGFYTNRIRYFEMLALFAAAGFSATTIEKRCWSTLPTPRAKLAGPFQALSDEELCVSDFSVVLT
jgi:SAM-dependent methyltransferase